MMNSSSVYPSVEDPVDVSLLPPSVKDSDKSTKVDHFVSRCNSCIVNHTACVATFSKYACNKCIANRSVCIFGHEECDNPPSILNILKSCTTCRVRRRSCVHSQPGSPCDLCLKTKMCCEFEVSSQGRRMDMKAVMPLPSDKPRSRSVTKEVKHNSKNNNGEGILDVYPDADRDDLCHRSRTSVMLKKSAEYPLLSKNCAGTSEVNAFEPSLKIAKAIRPSSRMKKKQWRRRRCRTSSQIPTATHVFKSEKNSSRRTQAGSIPSKYASSANLSNKTVLNRSERTRRKDIKRGNLKTCYAFDYSKKWTLDQLKDVTLVFDGGVGSNAPLQPPTGTKWTCLRIDDGDLFVADSIDPDIGVTYRGESSPFIRVPRREGLLVTSMTSPEECSNFCSAVGAAYNATHTTLDRGKKRRIFTDGFYSCIGPQARRAATGVSDESYHKNDMSNSHWDLIVNMVRRYENCFTSYVDTEEIRKINIAKALIGFKSLSLSQSRNETFSDHAKIFNGVAFGYNVFLSCHSDIDYTYSITSVYLEGHVNTLDDVIVAYFCFPRLGIAVALRPGDVLIFNPREPHAVSSRCRDSDRILCLSTYLKTAIVGLNDNAIPLTEEQERRVKIYEDIEKCSNNIN